MPVIQGYIISMAMSRAKAIEVIDGLADPLVEHLVKCLIVKDDELHKHWESEINAWLHKIAKIRLKPKDTPMKQKDIVCNLARVAFFLRADGYKEDIAVRQKYQKLPQTDYDLQGLRDIILNIYNDFAQKVSSDSFTAIDSIRSIEAYKRGIR